MTRVAHNPEPAISSVRRENGEQIGESRSQDTYERVRTAILNAELEAGKAYSQVALSRVLGVSRTPLREAIRRLQSEGLIESERNRRILVAPLDTDDLRQLYAIRVALEPLAVQISVPLLSEQDLVALRSALDTHTQACERHDLDEARAPHREFHLRLVKAAGQRFTKSLEDLWDHAERYRRLYFQSQGDQMALFQLASSEHEQIYAAAAAGDGLGCSDALARHLSRTAIAVLSRMDGSIEPTDVRAALRMVLGDR